MKQNKRKNLLFLFIIFILSLWDSIIILFKSIQTLMRVNRARNFKLVFARDTILYNRWPFQLLVDCAFKFQSKQETFAFLVDLSCAFDTMPRSMLLYKLASSTHIIEILKLFYEDTSNHIGLQDELSPPFYANQGVRQGSLLSLTLFSLYLNDTEMIYLKDFLPGGVNVANFRNSCQCAPTT